MKVLLVYPRWNYPTFGQLQEPLGLLYLAAVLKEAGHEVTVIDLAIAEIERVDEAVRTADLLGISSSTVLFGRALKVLERVKALRPDLPAVLGGPHATVRPEEAVRAGFDAAAVGEGEATVVELCAALEAGRPLWEVPGLVAREGAAIKAGPPRSFIADLDRLPDVDRTRVDYPAYFAKNLVYVGMMATRGCPFNCLFCKPMQDKLFGRKVRRRSVGRLVAEMRWIADHLGRRHYMFKDDTLALVAPAWFDEFAAGLKAAGLPDASWSCQARVDQIDKPLLAAMVRGGLAGIAFGVESGSQRVLDFYRKGIKVEDTERAFAICREFGVGTHAFIMLGAPEETREDLEATIRLIERIRPISVSVSLTTPAPGSDLYQVVDAMGRLNLKGPEDADYLFNRDPIRLEHLTMKDIAWAESQILDLVPQAFFRDQLTSRADQLAGV